MYNDDIRVIRNEDYPQTLKNMKSPPPMLYVRGTFPAPKENRYLCVVGSRRWTSYGRDAVYKILIGLKGYPISIVSGLAVGIDSIAHMAALEAGLHCVAFPGSSLDWKEIYPPSHAKLARMIVDKGGALVSRWPIGYPTGRWSFPARNTFMAGLSHATLIVEAARRSGSLMTARHAEEYDRDTLAVPGSIFASQSYGPHMLIRRGAGMVTSSEDLLDALGFRVSKRSVNGGFFDKIKSLDALSAEIMQILSREESTTSGLIEKTGSHISKLNEKLSILELEGLITIEDGMIKVARQ